MSKLINYIIDNDLSDTTFYGKVLWWSDNKGCGIIKMSNGSEVYVDNSVTKKRSNLKRNETVSFKFNVNIKDTACAMNVEVCEHYDTVKMLIGLGKELLDKGVINRSHLTCDRILIEAACDDTFNDIEDLSTIYYKAENYIHESLEQYLDRVSA